MLNHYFIGWQEMPKSMGGGKMALFNLTQPLGNHPIGSTVTERTLRQHGYTDDQICGLILAGTLESVECPICGCVWKSSSPEDYHTTTCLSCRANEG